MNDETKNALMRLRAMRGKEMLAKPVKHFEKAQEAVHVRKGDLLHKDGFDALEAALDASAASAIVTDAARGRYTDGNVTLDDSQIVALEGLLQNKYAALIGYAGSGKTTVLKFLTQELRKHYQEREIAKLEYDERLKVVAEKRSVAVPIWFAAYTGRASEMIALKMPQGMRGQVSTIHRLLGYHPAMVDKPDADSPGGWKQVQQFVPAYTAENKLPYKCIVIDEAGMCPPDLWNNLLAACEDDCRIYLVGDISQLPPVMGISPLPLAMSHLPTFELQKIHRQALDSPIIANATLIRKGQKPDNAPGKFLSYMVECSGAGGAVDAAIFRAKVLASIKTLHDKGSFDPWLDIVLVPIAKRENATSGMPYEASAGMFNADLRSMFNGDKPRVLIRGGMRAFEVSDVAIDDKLMITRNGTLDRTDGGLFGVTNGMLGRVVGIRPNPLYRGKQEERTTDDIAEDAKAASAAMTIDLHAMFASNVEATEESRDETETTRQCSHIVELELLGRNGVVVQLRTAGDFSNLMYAYAITVHKSQGGEYRKVFIALCSQGAGSLLSREWLYTAVTRAKDACVIFHDPIALVRCLKNQRIKGKTLAEKAASVLALCSKGSGDYPRMPEPALAED